MNALSAAGLADLAGVTAAEVQRLVDLGVLVARDGTGPNDGVPMTLGGRTEQVRSPWPRPELLAQQGDRS
jgi:hypothetical protein